MITTREQDPALPETVGLTASCSKRRPEDVGKGGWKLHVFLTSELDGEEWCFRVRPLYRRYPLDRQLEGPVTW